MDSTKISEQEIEPHTVVYSRLEDEITSFLNSNGYNCIFDVSAILKGYLVDLYALLLSKNVEDIYAFELKLRGRTYDENELIHNLSLDRGDYEFVNLTKSNYTKDRIIKTKHEEELLVNKAGQYRQANILRNLFCGHLRFFTKFWIQMVAQRIPDQVEGQDRRGNRQPREYHQPPPGPELVGQHPA